MRFFLDLKDGGTVVRDDSGVDVPNLDAARIEAIVTLTEMAREWLPSDGNNRDISLIIRSPAKPLLEVSFRFEVKSLDRDVQGDDKVLAHDRQRRP